MYLAHVRPLTSFACIVVSYCVPVAARDRARCARPASAIYVLGAVLVGRPELRRWQYGLAVRATTGALCTQYYRRAGSQRASAPASHLAFDHPDPA